MAAVTRVGKGLLRVLQTVFVLVTQFLYYLISLFYVWLGVAALVYVLIYWNLLQDEDLWMIVAVVALNTSVLLAIQSLPGELAKLGASMTRYPPDWDYIRRAVYRRSGYKCQNCGQGDTELHAHHIVPLSVGGTNAFTNLACLCRDCHRKIHPHMR